MISFVYFDIGGVVVDDFSGNNKWQELGEEMGLSADKREGFKDFWTRYEKEFCTTHEIDTFLPNLEQALGVKLPDGFSLLKALVDRFYTNEPIWPVITDMQSKTRIGLLTNASPRMLDLITQKGILPDVEWDQVVDSSVEHVMKPDPRIFQIAEERAGVPGSEILFIDNKESHCDAARAFGWQTFYYNSADRAQSAHELADFLKSQQFSR